MKSKKLFATALAAVMLLCSVSLPDGFCGITVGIGAYALEYNDYEYTDNGAGITISQYNGTDTQVVIPSEISGKPVTVIGEWAFYDTQITSVVIPENVTLVDARAFYNCTKLTSVVFPSTLVEIGNEAFGWCESLQELNFNKGLKIIGEYAFVGISQTEDGEMNVIPITIDLPAGLETLGQFAFEDSLNIIIINSKTLDISESGFQWWNNVIVCPSGSVAETYLKTSEITYYLTDACGKVSGFSTAVTAKRTTVTLNWNQSIDPTTDGYEIYSKGQNDSAYALSATISNPATTTKTIKQLTAGTLYNFKIREYKNVDGKKVYGEFSNPLVYRTLDTSEAIAARNALITEGATAEINEYSSTLKAEKYTSAYISRCAEVSEISQFVDSNGLYTYAYGSDNYLYIVRMNKDMEVSATLKIAKKFPLLGTVVSDGNYYYVVWGQNDTEGKGGVKFISVSKYTYSGSHVKTTSYTSSGDSGLGTLDTRYTFYAPAAGNPDSYFICGNCDATVANGVLVVTFGRGMYNGHQSCATIAVNMSDMSKNESVYNYASHSFDQRILTASDGTIWYADHGDAYDRSFCVTSNTFNSDTNLFKYGTRYTKFNFYGDCGDNWTGAQLGGLAEVSTGVILCGAATKSMTSDADNEQMNLFIQLQSDTYTLTGSVSRTGTSCATSCKDTGVRWLTNYSVSGGNSAENPQIVATDDDRLVVMWEKYTNYEFKQSYYMILSADGTILQKATPMGEINLNAYEDPVYLNGSVIWTSATGKKATTYELVVDGINKPLTSDNTTIKLGFTNATYTGKAKTPSVTVTMGTTKLTADVDYTVTYSNNINTGTAKVTVKGKGLYGGTLTKTFTIKPAKTTGLTATKNNQTYITLSWNKAGGNVTGYRIYRCKASGTYELVKTITSASTVTYKDTGLTAGTVYSYKVRAYKTINSVRVYGTYSDILKTATKTSTPTISFVSGGTKKLTVKWGEITKANGYEVYCSTSKTGTYTKYTTITSSSTVKATIKSLSAGKTYYVKVRAYKTVDGVKIYSSYSTAVAGKTA